MITITLNGGAAQERKLREALEKEGLSDKIAELGGGRISTVSREELSSAPESKSLPPS